MLPKLGVLNYLPVSNIDVAASWILSWMWQLHHLRGALMSDMVINCTEMYLFLEGNGGRGTCLVAMTNESLGLEMWTVT